MNSQNSLNNKGNLILCQALFLECDTYELIYFSVQPLKKCLVGQLAQLVRARCY